ncbi:MAG: phenylalanine--tRNA ligase subunit alpha, partial [Butyrivibrio sp.]|nr:phenylalanine--tRNA ligase subunit alpha [Butyrivibrio sp.]
MNDRLAGIRQEILNGIEQHASSRAAAFELRKQFLDSRTGKIGQMMKEMKNIAPEERASFGKNINELKEWAQQKFSELDEKLKAKELERRYESEKVDVTMPAQKMETGNLHPVT